MQHHYTLFVDEAGDDKVDRLKPLASDGNSEWLCLGGYLVRSEFEVDLTRRRDEILASFGGKVGGVLHYKNLKPKNRIASCKKLISKGFPARGFVVCSYKQTMLGYQNNRAASVATGNPRDVLYNFVCRLLLERVTEFVWSSAKRHGVDEPVLRIVMASRKGHHFGRFKAYVQQLINQAVAGTTYLDTRRIEERVLRPEQIIRLPASASPGLQLADTMVSAFFQSIEQLSPHNSDRPAELLRPLMTENNRFWSKKARYDNYGVTLYPAKDAVHLMSEGQLQFFKEFGYDIEWLKRQPAQKHKQEFSQSQRMWSNEYSE